MLNMTIEINYTQLHVAVFTAMDVQMNVGTTVKFCHLHAIPNTSFKFYSYVTWNLPFNEVRHEEKGTKIKELYSSHLEICIFLKILLPKRSTAIEMARKIPFSLNFCNFCTFRVGGGGGCYTFVNEIIGPVIVLYIEIQYFASKQYI